jgi:DNA-binding transcriptional MocR family regulator
MRTDPSTTLAHAERDSSAVLSAKTSLVDQIVQWAERRMAEQVFRPGMRMPSVRVLAEERGVSRFTVVEAYERLVARGALQARRGAGFFVREHSAPREKRIAEPVRSQAIDVGWLVRNMLSGIPAALSPGYGSLPSPLSGGNLIKMGLRSLTTLPVSQLCRGAQAQGYLPLREQLARKLAEIEIAATPAHVMTTSGCTQAVTLIADHFLNPGDVVLTSDPAWSAQLGALAMHDIDVIGVPTTENGPDLVAMANLAHQHKPRMLLINSVLQNPTGTVLSAAAAYQILRIAEQHDMLIVEDDIYTDFVPDGILAARLASLDQLQRVIYISSFSKMLAPSMRVGFIAARPDIIQDLVSHKLLSMWTTPELDERIVLSALTEGGYRKHCQRVHTKLDAVREPAFRRFEKLGFKPLCQPQAGFLGWFDTGVDTNVLAAAALDAGYLFAPGALFSVRQTPGTWLRMNITTSDDPAMLKWLERTLHQMHGQPGACAKKA